MRLLTISKKWLFENKWLVLGTLAVLVINYLYINKIFSFHFVDEEDNFILGNFLLGGQKLYSDLFSHHQPLGYIISAGYQFLVAPDNIFMLIKRHREFMIAWSVIWCTILIWKFKEKVIIPILIYEASKFFILGQLFLSESLAIYPVLYLTLFLFVKKSSYSNYEYLLAGLFISISALLLAPIWPFLAGYLLFLYWFKKPSFKQIGYIVISALVPILICLPFIDIYYYFHNVFYINFKYYIPQSGEERLPISIVKSFFSPITALLNSSSLQSSGFILKVSALFFIISIGYLIRIKNFRLLFAALTLLTLSNIRYFTPGLEYYSGFHLIIWYGLFLLISFYFFTELIENLKSKTIKTFLMFILFFALTVSLYSSKTLFQKNDKDHDYYVQYSQMYAFGEAIKGMKNEGDTLFVVPDAWLLYYQGDIKNNNKMVNFYGWMSLVWELNDLVVEKFKNNPPTFFYCDCDEKYVYNYAGENYHQMIRDGSKTPLWVLNSKFNSLAETQKDKLRFFHFEAQ